MHRLIDPCFEFTLGDEKEVAPTCWLPMTQTAVIFAAGADGKPFRDLTHTVKITEATVNQPLPDALFTVAFKEGAWVNDQTHDPPLRYRHKAVMPPEEWAKIIADGQGASEPRPVVRAEAGGADRPARGAVSRPGRAGSTAGRWSWATSRARS